MYDLIIEKGLPMDIVKKIGKDILNALETLHDMKIIHSDIKLLNVVTCVSQRSMFENIQKIASGRTVLKSLRMSCEQNAPFNDAAAKKTIKSCLKEIEPDTLPESPAYTFKLIDLGDVVVN